MAKTSTYLASTASGRDWRATLRVLVTAAIAIACVGLMVCLGPEWNPQDPGPTPLLPAIAGFAGGAMGYFVVAPRLFNELPSQWQLFEPDGLRIYGLGAEPEYSGPNKGLAIECAPGAQQAIALVVGEKRVALAEQYVEADEARFLAARDGAAGEKFRVPYVQLRAVEGSLRAVRLVPVSRYSSREEPVC